MIHDSEHEVGDQLDGLRYKKPKFICINDDMNRTTPNPKVKEMLHDFFNWYYPNQSQFELPPGKINPYLYIDDMNRLNSEADYAKYSVILFGVCGFILLCIIISYIRSCFGKKEKVTYDQEDETILPYVDEEKTSGSSTAHKRGEIQQRATRVSDNEKSV